MTPAVQVHLDDVDGLRVVALSGEVDLLTCPGLTQAVASWLDGAERLVLDLGQVSLLDSSGVRLLDRLMRSCSKSAVALRLVSPPGTLPRRVLQIVELDHLVCDDLEAARLAVAPPEG